MREVIIISADEKYEPPEEPVLNMAVIGDVVSLSICKYEAGPKVTTMTEIAGITVSAQQLLVALHSAIHTRDARPSPSGEQARPTR